jgi:hypothetical protein
MARAGNGFVEFIAPNKIPNATKVSNSNIIFPTHIIEGTKTTQKKSFVAHDYIN